MDKHIFQIIFLLVVCISVYIIYNARNLMAKNKSIKDVSSATRLLQVSGFVVAAVSLYIIYIHR